MAYRNRAHLRSVLSCPGCGAPLAWRSRNGRCERCELRVSDRNNAFVFHTEGLPENYANPEYASGNPYHDDCLEAIEKHPHGMVLNYGAGNPRFAFDNLVEAEIRQYPNTDLVVVSDRLPLRDNSVDAVISLSVLEHVKDPFRYIAEIRRVLKPGGDLVLHAAFMQPFHAYPDHYFNTTKAGMMRLMDGFDIARLKVGDHQHPWIMLNWVLNSYLRGLEEADRQWLLSQPLGTLMDLMRRAAKKRQAIKERDDPHEIARGLATFNRDHADDLGALTRLSPQMLDTLAAGFALSAVLRQPAHTSAAPPATTRHRP